MDVKEALPSSLYQYLFIIMHNIGLAASSYMIHTAILVNADASTCGPQTIYWGLVGVQGIKCYLMN